MATGYTRRESAELMVAAIKEFGPLSRVSIIAHTRLKTHAVHRGLAYLRDVHAIRNTAPPGSTALYAWTGQELPPPSPEKFIEPSGCARASFDALLSVWHIRHVCQTGWQARRLVTFN